MTHPIFTEEYDLIRAQLRRFVEEKVKPEGPKWEEAGFVPREILRACCILARYDLSVGGDREPADQVKADRRDVVAWLTQLSNGTATLEGVAPIEQTSSARASDRPRMFGRRGEVGL